MYFECSPIAQETKTSFSVHNKPSVGWLVGCMAYQPL